ncbi:MAG: DUF1573 domain-containing protein [Planctomycetota bacterium]|jgi:hypothetical protein
MKKIYWVVFVIVINCFQVKAENTTAKKENAEGLLPYRIIPSPVILGDLAYGTKSKFSFTVFNKSDNSFKILKVRPNCTCLKVTGYSKDEIKAGGKGVVDAVITADKKEGKTRKVFYLHFSDKTNPIAKLYVNVNFVKGKGGKLTLSGKEIDFGKIKRTDKNRMAVLRLMNFGDMPLKIVDIICKNEAVRLKLDNNNPVQPHKGVTLRAYIDGTKVKADSVTEEVFIMTDSALSPAVSVKLKAIVK